MNDEYIQFLRLKSFASGFWMLIGGITLLGTLSLVVDMNVQFILLVLIVVGVVSTMTAYLYYEND